MATVIIPTTPEPNQQFTVDIDGQTIDITIRWNATAGQWFMDFVGVTFETILNGVALATGVDLLAPYAVRELGQLWCVDVEEKEQEPDFDKFGDQFQLFYVEK